MTSQWNSYTMENMEMMRLGHPVCHRCLIEIKVGDKVVAKHACRKNRYRIYHQSCYDQLFFEGGD